MPITLIILGFGLVGVGVFFAVGGLGGDSAQGSAMRGIQVQGPAWLILIALGVGTIVFGAWQFEGDDATAVPPKEEETVVTVPPGDPEPFTYGDDATLDALWDACATGNDWVACDDLYLESPFDSDYEFFGATCGLILEGDGEFCQDVPPGIIQQAYEDGKLPNSD